VIKLHPKEAAAAAAAKTDPFEARRAELSRVPVRTRVAAIETELKAVARQADEAATFHRKKLLRMHDAARLEAGLVTSTQLQQENSPFTDSDFATARIVWRERPRVRV